MYVRSYRPLGFSKAVNTGIRLCDSKYITICNDDVEFISNEWWGGILDTFKLDKKILAVNPSSPKEAGWGYGWSPDKYVHLLPYKEEYSEEDYNFLMDGDFSQVEELPDTFPRKRTGVIDAIATWCTVFKKEALLPTEDETGIKEAIVGLFDERFYPSGGEDYDLMARAYSPAWRGGRYRMVGTSLSWVYHHWSSTKDYLGDLPELDKSKYWNRLGELWHDKFDVWGFSQDKDEKGDRIPCVRVPIVYMEEL
jgi:GT2 family glycosyltransferase